MKIRATHSCRTVTPTSVELPQGAVVGTSSLRRVVQLMAARPDLTVVPLRGNLDTRLSKLDEGGFDAIVLAAAGLKRLGLAARIRSLFNPETMIPAAGQGALGLEVREDAHALRELLARTLHRPTFLACHAERAVSRALGGSCSMPLAAHAVWEGDKLCLDAALGDPACARGPCCARGCAPRWPTRRRRVRWASRRRRSCTAPAPAATCRRREPAMRLIVTRPRAQAAAWVRELQALGQQVSALPLIDIAPLDEPAPLHRAWQRLDAYALVVFVSANAVQHFFAAAPAGSGWPVGVLARVHQATSAALRAAGVPAAALVEPAADAPAYDSEALWAQVSGPGLGWARVLVVRGEDGRDWLARTLRARGAAVDFVAAYRRRPPLCGAAETALLQDALAAPAAHLWLFSSSEAVANLRPWRPRPTGRAAPRWRRTRASCKRHAQRASAVSISRRPCRPPWWRCSRPGPRGPRRWRQTPSDRDACAPSRRDRRRGPAASTPPPAAPAAPAAEPAPAATAAPPAAVPGRWTPAGATVLAAVSSNSSKRFVVWYTFSVLLIRSGIFNSYQVTLPDGRVTTVGSVLADARRARGKAIATAFRAPGSPAAVSVRISPPSSLRRSAAVASCVTFPEAASRRAGHGELGTKRKPRSVMQR